MTFGETLRLSWWENALYQLQRLWAFLGQKLGDLLDVLLFLSLVILASVPLWQDEFSFRMLFASRLSLAAAMLPLVEMIASQFTPRFKLRRFRINPPSPSRRLPSLGDVVSILLAIVVFFIDPIGLYASGHSKALIPVFYITDRQANPGGSPAFSSEASSTEEISYGSAAVPVTWSRSDILHNLTSPPALLSWTKANVSLQNMSEREFYAEVDVAIQASQQHEAFLFIHGFHNSFEEGLNRAASLSYDFKFQGTKVFRGVSILYSWPAGTAVQRYDHDKDNALWSVDHLKGVLVRLANSPSTEQLHVIAHSMGSRVLAGAVKSLDGSGVTPGRFKNIIFAAADIDENNFTQAAPKLKTYAGRITIYVSGWDLALQASSALHEGSRVGLHPRCWDGMDVVDTQGQDTSIRDFNHSYLFDSQPVLYDLGGVLQGTPPDARLGIREPDNECFWVFAHR